MNLTYIYRRLASHKINLSVAADELGLSEEGLKIRISKWGDRLPLLLLTLDQIVAGAVSRGDAAKTLGVSPREVNKLMKSWSVQRPISSYLIDRASTSLKWDIRTKYSIEYISGTTSLEAAAQRAGVSDRQLRRWVSDLLEAHHGMVFKDLRKLHSIERGQIAKKIADDQELGPEKQKKLTKISSGESSIATEAVALVVEKAKGRRFRELPDA